MNDRRPIGIMRRIKGAMLRHMHNMITCREFEEFIVDYLEGDLPPRQVKIFELHLRVCRECREYLAAYRRTIDLGGAISAEEEALPEEIPEDLVAAVLDARRS